MKERKDDERGDAREPGETEAQYRERFERAWQYSHDAGGTDE